MLKGPKVASSQPGPRAQEIINPHHQAIKETERIAIEAFKRGLILLPVGYNRVRIAPPLNISKELLDEGLDILFDAIKAVEVD